MHCSFGIVLISFHLLMLNTLGKWTKDVKPENSSILKPWGRNVVTRLLHVYAKQTISVSVPYYVVQCTKTMTHCHSWWGCNKRTVCRRVLRHRYQIKETTVIRIRPVVVCMSGWQQQGSECTIPICQSGCSSHGRCIKPRQCRCDPGWTGATCNVSLNKCAINNGGCVQRCVNLIGSFRCECYHGYYKSIGGQCFDINECLQTAWPSLCQQRCINTNGSYYCACRSGYKLNPDKKTCSANVDECRINNGGCFYKCVNTDSGYYCTCPSGFALASNGKECIDRNECRTVTGGNRCEQLCVNHVGGYACACYRGYKLDANNYTCSDIDECAPGGTAGCSHKCNNTMGSYLCSCRHGYVLGQDKQTCYDLNECQFGLHSCSQGCVNIIGRYYCTCRPGFVLAADGRTCRGKVCSPIRPPLQGHMNCSGFSTGSRCRFGCRTGYDLVGSRTRLCLPNLKWSGSISYCRVKHCNDLSPPTNGFIKIPCRTSYNSKCTVGCQRGFYLNGSAETTCSAEGGWTPLPGRCMANQICVPNPCRNGGRCIPIGPKQTTCNCTHTGYRGVFCNVGFIVTPNYPRLMINQSVTLSLKLSPTTDVVAFTPLSDGVTFEPKSVTISYDRNSPSKLFEVNVTMTAVTPGLHDVTYGFSGPGANVYGDVEPDVIIVNDNRVKCGSDAEVFPPSCSKLNLKTCPRTEGVISAQSSAGWDVTSVVYTSKGVAILNSSVSNLVIPFSLRGVRLPRSINPSAMPFKIPSCAEHPEAKLSLQCLPPSFLASLFLNATKHALPPWFSITPINNRATFCKTDLGTYFVPGRILKEAIKGLQLEVDTSSYFAVLLYTGPVSISLNGSSTRLPDYGKESYLAVAVNLCSQRQESNSIVSFSLPSLQKLDSLRLMQDLRLRGWEVRVLGFQTSLVKSPFGYFSSLDVWNGTVVKSISVPPGNVEVFGGTKNFLQGVRFSRGALDFLGNAILSLPDLENALSPTNPRRNEWRAQFKGSVKLSLKSVVRGRLFDITDAATRNVSGYVTTYYDEVKGWCNQGNQLAVFFRGTIVGSPFRSTFLEDYLVLFPNTTAKYFIDSQLVETRGDVTFPEPTLVLGIHAKGTAKYGHLRAQGALLEFTLRDVDSSRKVKECRIHDSGSVTGATIVAKFNNRTKFGCFFNSDPGQGHFFKITITSLSSDASLTLKATAEFLGEMFPVTLKLSREDDLLRVHRNGMAYGKFAVVYKASAALRGWDVLEFNLTGRFASKNETRKGRSLHTEVEKVMADYIREISLAAERRINTASFDVIRARRRLGSATRKLRNSEKAYGDALKRYSRALNEKNNAELKLEAAKKQLKNLSAEFNQSKQELERLCVINNCPVKCVAGVNCRTCVKPIFTKVRGLCPNTCYRTRWTRVPPFGTWSVCTRDRCEARGRLGGRWYRKRFRRRNVSCQFTGYIIWMFRMVRRPHFWKKSVTTLPPGVTHGIADGCISFAESRFMGLSLNPSLYSRNVYSTAHMNFHHFQDSCRLLPDASDHLYCWKENYFCYHETYNYRTTAEPYPCQVECEKEVFNGTIRVPCCMESKCARRVVDTECVKRNTLCRIIREKAMNKFNETKQKLMGPLRKVQEARFNYSLAEIRFQKVSLEVGLEGGRVRVLKNTVEALNSAVLITERAYRNIWNRLNKAASLRNQWRSSKGRQLVNITRATFDVKINTNKLTLLPYKITVAAQNEERVFSEVINFDQVEVSLKNAARKILESFYGNVFAALRENHPYNDHVIRTKRAAGVAYDSLTPLVDYKKKCLQFTTYERGLRTIFGSLHRLSIKTLTLYRKFIAQGYTESARETEGVLIDKQFATKLGISALDIQVSGEALETDQVVKELSSMKTLESVTGKELLQLSMDMMYLDWLASIEQMFNLTNSECSGFNDCLMNMIDNLYHLFDGINLPQSKHLQTRIINVKKLLSNMTAKDNLTVLETISQTKELFKILNETRRIKIFCAVAPNITEQPAAFTELRTGETLNISCRADGDPELFFMWMKDGKILEGRRTSNLVINKVKSKDTGIYICKVANFVGNQDSVPARVIVHGPPVITKEPSSMVAEIVNGQVFLICNATSSKQPLSYRWYFKPSSRRNYIRISNAVYPVLQIIPLVNDSEGWYYCNVSNRYGYAVSRTSHVIGLKYTLVSPVIQIQVHVTANSKTLDELNASENKKHQLFASSIQKVLLPLANLTNNAVSALAVSDCRLIGTEKTCKLWMTFQGENMTDTKTMNNSLETNSVMVLKAVNKLQLAIKSMVAKSQKLVSTLQSQNNKYSLTFDNWIIGDLEHACGRGQRLHNNQFMCVNCPPGTRAQWDGIVKTCFLCDIGTYQPFQGQTSCQKCPDGFTNQKTGNYKMSSCKIHKGFTKLTSPSSPRPTQGPVPTTLESLARKTAKQEIGWIIGTVVVAVLVLVLITGVAAFIYCRRKGNLSKPCPSDNSIQKTFPNPTYEAVLKKSSICEHTSDQLQKSDQETK